MDTNKKAAKTVLILHAEAGSDQRALKDASLVALVDNLVRNGASVRVLPFDRDFDTVADAIGTSDSVVFWR